MLTDEEIERYSRHLLVRDFGAQGQLKLRQSHIAVVGAGGIGAPLLAYLAGAGVGEITLFEDDDIALSNFHRQIIYRSDQLGASKSQCAREAIRALNPNVKINLAGRFEGQSNNGASLIVDGSDQLDTRQAVNRAGKAWGVPVLAASLSQWEGQISHFDPANHKGCFECLYPEGTDASAIPSCSEAGVIGPMAGVIGTMAALEAIKTIAGIQPLAAGKIMMIDGLYRESRVLNITARDGCPVCGKGV